MLVLVTGGTGFVGSHTVRALADAGHDVRLLVRDPGKVKRVFDARGTPIAELHVGDVTEAASVERAIAGCDAVLHCAGMVSLQASRAEEVHRTNTSGVRHVVGGAWRAGVAHIVYVSSASALMRPDGPVITADAPLGESRTAYGRSKIECERIVRGFRDEGAPVYSSYPTGVIGPDDPGESESNEAIRVLARSFIPITSSGFQMVDVRDLAALHVALLEGNPPSRGYVAAGVNLSWKQLADMTDALTGERVRRIPAAPRLLRGIGHLGDLVKRVLPFDLPITYESMSFATQWPGADATPAESELGIRFRAPEETLADTLRWLHAAGRLEARHVGRLTGQAGD